MGFGCQILHTFSFIIILVCTGFQKGMEYTQTLDEVCRDTISKLLADDDSFQILTLKVPITTAADDILKY